MKILFTIFLLIFFHTSHGQDCKVEQYPIPPALGIEVNALVSHKNNISFYAVEGVKDSLIIYMRLNDVWERTVQIGDSSM
jgi:hypothetical protein